MELAVIFSAFVTVLLSSFTFSLADDNDYSSVLFKCFEESGATPEDGIIFMDSAVASENLKCAFRCMADHYNAIKADGTFDVEKAVAVMPRTMADITRKCSASAQPSSDPCEVGYQFHKCMLQTDPEVYKSMGEETLNN